MSDDSPVSHDGNRDSSSNKQDEPRDRFSQMQKEFEAMMAGEHGIKPPRSSDRPASFTPAHHYHIPDFDSPDPDMVNDQAGKQFLLTLLLGLMAVAVAAVIAATMLLPVGRTTTAGQTSHSGSVATPAVSESDTSQQSQPLPGLPVAVQATEPANAVAARIQDKHPPTVTKQIAANTATSPITPASPLQQSGNSDEWVIYLASFTDPKAVQSELSRLQASGISSGSSKTIISGRLWYRVYARGYHSAAQAKAALASFAKNKNYDSPWISKKPD